MSEENILEEIERLTEVLATIELGRTYEIQINGQQSYHQAIKTARDIGIEIQRLVQLLKEDGGTDNE